MPANAGGAKRMDENTLIARKAPVWQPAAIEFASGAGTLPSTLPEVYLHPGQNHVTGDASVIKMILGSCAGVFLFDTKLAVGGAAHFMLPSQPQGPPSARYGDVAIAELLESFRLFGSRRSDIQARIFGGAGMLQALEGLNGSRI